MAQLHLIQNPISPEQMTKNLGRFASKGDSWLFLNDATLCLVGDSIKLAEHDIVSAANCYALKSHCDARNITHLIRDKLVLIDYATFVTLCESHQKVITW